MVMRMRVAKVTKFDHGTTRCQDFGHVQSLNHSFATTSRPPSLDNLPSTTTATTTNTAITRKPRSTTDITLDDLTADSITG